MIARRALLASAGRIPMVPARGLTSSPAVARASNYQDAIFDWQVPRNCTQGAQSMALRRSGQAESARHIRRPSDRQYAQRRAAPDGATTRRAQRRNRGRARRAYFRLAEFLAQLLDAARYRVDLARGDQARDRKHRADVCGADQARGQALRDELG